MQKELTVHKSISDFFIISFCNDIEFIEGTVTVEKIYKNFGLCVQAHISNILCLAISSDDKCVASGSNSDKMIRVWNIKEKTQEYFLAGDYGIYRLDLKYIQGIEKLYLLSYFDK